MPSVQLRLWHQVGVQQAPEEQAWPEVGGERRRPQVGGTFESLVLIVTFLSTDDKPGKPGAVPWSSGFSGGKLGHLSNPVSHLMGVYWMRSGPCVWLLMLSCVATSL